MANINFNLKGFSFNDNGTNVNLDEVSFSTDISAEDAKVNGETMNKAIPVIGNLVKEILAQQNKHDAEQAAERRKAEKELEELKERNNRLNRIDDNKFKTLEDRLNVQECNTMSLNKSIDEYATMVTRELEGVKAAVDHVKGIREKIAGISNDKDRN